MCRTPSPGNLAASGLKGRDVPSELEGFINGHIGPDRQLTLRMASFYFTGA